MDPESNPVVQLVHSHPCAQVDIEQATKEAAVAEKIPIDGSNTAPSRQIDEEDDYPGDRWARSAWVVLAGSFLALFPSFGLMVSIGTLQEYWQFHQLSDYSSQEIGWIPSVFVYLALGLGICFGPLFDMFGPRWIMLISSVAYIAMIFLLAECTKYWQFLLCLGLLGGPAAAALTTTALAVVSHWFKDKRGLASGIAMVGNSLGGVVIPLVLRTTFQTYGYTWSIRIIGFVFLACLIVSNFLVRSRLAPSPEAKKAKIFSLQLFGDPAFSFLTVSLFGIEVVLFGSLGILPTYAGLGTDYPAETGFYLIAIMNASSCFGRIIPGFVSDIVGRFNVLGVMMVTTLVLMLVIWLPFGQSSLAALYVFIALYGFGTGSWMAMAPACIGQLSGAQHFGRYFGTMYFIASLATLVCIPISGELVQRVGPQPLVGFMCAVLALSIGTFVVTRFALLGWRWRWKVVV